MTAGPRRSARTADARRDFEEALARLHQGRPENHRLAKLADVGKLRITVASVAQEAGRSRTLIGTVNCRFPDVRDRIIKGAPREKGSTSAIDGLRRENKMLRAQVELLRSQQALALARILKAEHEVELIRGDFSGAPPPTIGAGRPGVVLPMPIRPPPRPTRK